LDEIQPLIEMNLIQLGSNELPDGAAFRIPEHDSIGISMNKDNFKGKSQTIAYIGMFLKLRHANNNNHNHNNRICRVICRTCIHTGMLHQKMLHLCMLMV
jgi:hypothetical protein